ncbi:nicotinamide-nucleotide amidase [Flavobacterium croceum DSM 17960]|uniref:CinA-like protein n=1 Tax=Flavobacterium croceum DSM 17960 TaxID=1121886 RepID=A0A2S4N7T1_9FLAO|nr:CinA family nicotinamide mononucleotide deamidase-related protein [Flavobacterium croceum]POS01721.1 nicotinamide-nucleotide amidase [Flavobacterium croceum DSM 17960]
MKAAIVTIGDEILIGQIVDTNSGFIAKALDKIGVQTHEMLSISDDKQHILSTFSKLQNKVDLVLITGGLGPTKDDITKKTFCEYFDDTLIENREVLAHVTHLIENFFKRPINQMNRDQALVPSKCQVLFNKVGTAPGMWMQKENTIYVSLPGVPYEMKYLVEEVIVPKLVTEYKRPYILHKTILTYGQGESLVAERIEAWENNLPSFIKLAYLPAPGRVRLRLTARGENAQILEDEIARQVQALSQIIGDIIVGYDENETLEVVVGKLLNKANKTLALAESCTGGKISELVTSVAGSSSYFKGSVVSYATETKIKILGVLPEMIETHSVVSAAVAEQMALGAQKLFQTDYAIATTGNAGPTAGETNEKVGTVYIAIATPNGCISEKFELGEPREKVINRASNKGLEMLQKEILKNI